MIEAQNGIQTLLMAPQAMTNSATVTANFDTLESYGGARYADITIGFAAELNTNAVGPTLALTESDDTVVTNFATFDSNFARSAEDLTTAKIVRYQVELTPKRKRYLRLSVTTATATNDDVTLCAVGTLTRNPVEPASTSDMQASTSDVVVIG